MLGLLVELIVFLGRLGEVRPHLSANQSRFLHLVLQEPFILLILIHLLFEILYNDESQNYY
jgi:hypothetical protein